MKESIAILILLACACSSFAQNLPANLASKVTATTFILDEPDQYCTVSPISRDGYMITALHCVRDCLLQAAAADAGTIPFAGFDLFVSARPRATNVVCKNVAIPALGVKQVTVVETGTALSQFDSHFMSTYPDAMAELKAHGFVSRGNDFAILKIAASRPLACWPLGTAAAGTNIWALGYPLPDDPAKQKPVLTPTVGHVYASALESQAYKAATEAVDQTYLAMLYSDPSVLYSNAATTYGQSGGPVIDGNGNLVGVVSGFTSLKPDKKTDVHELVAVTSASILKMLSPALQATLTRASAQCR